MFGGRGGEEGVFLAFGVSDNVGEEQSRRDEAQDMCVCVCGIDLPSVWSCSRDSVRGERAIGNAFSPLVFNHDAPLT